MLLLVKDIWIFFFVNTLSNRFSLHIHISSRDMKTLSGGEKSYSTISLVLALWSQIQPPFRILDEFDVFMDSLNRRIALDQIINYAKVYNILFIYMLWYYISYELGQIKC